MASMAGDARPEAAISAGIITSFLHILGEVRAASQNPFQSSFAGEIGHFWGFTRPNLSCGLRQTPTHAGQKLTSIMVKTPLP
jgi:hypothetical protein